MLLITIVSLGLLTIVQGQCALKTIAFTAALSESKTIRRNQDIVYDTTITNYGLAYDNKTGIFTSPTEGVFLFQFHLLNTENNSAWVDLLLNDNMVVSAYGQNSSLNDYGGNSVILTLEQGDRVNIMTRGQSGLFGKPDRLHTTFSGVYVGPSS